MRTGHPFDSVLVTDPDGIVQEWEKYAAVILNGDLITAQQRHEYYVESLYANQHKHNPSLDALVEDLFTCLTPAALHTSLTRAHRNRATKDDVIPVELLIAGWKTLGPHFVRLIHVLIANYALPPEFRDPLLLFL